ncbi:MAG: hypothetical protein J2O38_01950 [Acidimicrobiales bacterium]|nr:hypothetical protein [Acidimicrobiales bacterium]
MLVALTIGALIPLGVGFAVALSAGGLVSPPSATLSSAGGEVGAARGAWCWQARGQHHCAPAAAGAASRAPVLAVSRDHPTVEVRFDIRQSPTTLQVTVTGPGGTGGGGVRVEGRNPGRFVVTSLPDGAFVSVRAGWPEGYATYLARLRLT